MGFNDDITLICKNFIDKIVGGSYLEVLFEYIKNDIIFFLIMFFLGTSIVGTPLTIIPLIIKNSFIGYLSSYMYCEYDLKGILFSLVLLYPLFVVTTTSLIYAANESVYMSKFILNTLTKRNTADNISIRLYVLRYAVLFGINLSGIAVNSFLIVTLANKFNLY
jgi:stage II sporulation protein M